MHEPVAIQAPVSAGQAVELARQSRLFRKQVLRTGRINYRGRQLVFDDAYLDGLVKAYQERAFDSVPLVFAPADNSHTQDITRIRGEVIGLERTPEGLDAIVRASNDEAATLLRENPNIGVSVRIEQPIERADGRTWDAAVQHVLATANPRLTGMSPWQPVDLAADGVPVIDLTSYDFADGGETADDSNTEETTMADSPASPFTAEQEAALKAMLADIIKPTEAPAPAEGEYVAPSDEELERIAAELLEDAEEPEPAGAALSVDDGEAVELAARLDAQAIELAQMRAERDAERYARLADSLTKDHGIPPEIIAMAKPVLHGSHPVELSNGSTVDAADVLRKVMVALSDHTRLVDLSRSTAYDKGADEAAQDMTKARQDADSYAREFGLV
jgi:hypothetical protein